MTTSAELHPSPMSGSERPDGQHEITPVEQTSEPEQLAEIDKYRRGQVFTMVEAAKRSGVSRSSIQRMHAAGKFPNAYQAPGSSPSRPWLIPLADLLAAGLLGRSVVSSSERASEQRGERATGDDGHAERAAAQLLQELTTERARRAALEQLIAVKDQVIDAQQNTIDALQRLLGPGNDDNTPKPDMQSPRAEEENGSDRLSEIPISGPTPAMVENPEKTAQPRGFWGWLRDL
jgi:hypothetical protein